MGWRLFEWHNMGKWIQRAFSAFPCSIPDGNKEIWSIDFLDWSIDWVCEEGWETITSFLEGGSDFWACISLGIVTFFLKYTLLVIRFLGVGLSGNDSGLEK